jgi:hypothetical protein
MDLKGGEAAQLHHLLGHRWLNAVLERFGDQVLDCSLAKGLAVLQAEGFESLPRQLREFRVHDLLWECERLGLLGRSAGLLTLLRPLLGWDFCCSFELSDSDLSSLELFPDAG